MPVKSPSKKKVTATKTPAKKTAAKKTASPKSAVKKTPTKKAATAKSAAKKTVAKKTPAPKSAVAKSAAKKTPAKKTSAAQSAARKTAPTQSAPKSASANKSPTGSSGADFAAAYTLPQLARRAGAATVEEARALAAVPDAQLIAEGAQVSTSRISVDCGRIYGQTLDLLAQATPKTRAALLGVTADLVRVAIFAALHGDQLYTSRNQEQALQRSRQTSRRATAAAALARGMARREQLRALYLAITADEPTWRGRIAAAYGVAKEPENLAAALTGLAALGDELLVSADAELRARQKDSGLTAALITEVRTLADDIAVRGPAGAAARELSAVSQGEVDLWDGLNLLLLERIVNLVNAAHEIEPSIPRLVLISLRTYFYGGSSKKATPAPPATGPAPT